LRGRSGTFGILEAFSNQPYAFSGSQVTILSRLVEIAEAAYKREGGEEHLLAPPPKRRFRLREPYRNSTEEALPSEVFDDASNNSRRRYWLVGASVTLLLLTSAVVWISWYAPDDEVVFGDSAPQSKIASADTPNRPTSAELSSKPAPSRGTPHFDALRHVKRATVETAEGVIRTASLASPEATPEDSSKGLKQESTVSEEEAPEVVAGVADSNALAILTSTPERLPNLDIPMSQGVTDAVLIYKVQPVYPLQARAAHIEGSVILETTITEQGATRNIRIISGPPELVHAATEAVRHWRYRPALLNGNATAVEKQIQVIFKAP
jgi:TonB family protein